MLGYFLVSDNNVLCKQENSFSAQTLTDNKLGSILWYVHHGAVGSWQWDIGKIDARYCWDFGKIWIWY